MIYFRIRKLSLNFLSPDEDRPLVNPINESTPIPLNQQQLPSIVIEQPDTVISIDSPRQRQRTSSSASNNNDTKL